MAEFQSNDNTQILQKIWSYRSVPSLLVGMQNGTVTWKSLAVPFKINILFPCDLTIITLYIYPSEMKNVLITSCVWMFLAVSPLIAKNMKQPNCFSMDK